MTFDEIKNSKKFQEVLLQIPEEQREQVIESLRSISNEFEDKVIKPLENLSKEQQKEMKK